MVDTEAADKMTGVGDVGIGEVPLRDGGVTVAAGATGATGSGRGETFAGGEAAAEVPDGGEVEGIPNCVDAPRKWRKPAKLKPLRVRGASPDPTGFAPLVCSDDCGRDATEPEADTVSDGTVGAAKVLDSGGEGCTDGGADSITLNPTSSASSTWTSSLISSPFC